MRAYEAAAEELRPNPAQWSAYEASGHVVILAGPGSGKTKVLTTKIARLLAEEVRPPRGIACVTYSNECARELERRMSRLGVSSSDTLFIGTLHGFCLRHIIGPFGALTGLPQKRQVASTKVRQRLLGAALERVGIRQPVSDWETPLTVYRLKTLDREIDANWTVGDRAMTDVCIAYERALESENLIDFDGTIIESLRVIEQNDWARRALCARFPVLVVDEYQDLGLPLHRLVLSLCFGTGVRLVAVGDPDQSIYAFRGAVPELLTQLAARPDVERITFQLNYRSGRSIVDASQGLLGLERSYQAHSTENGIIRAHKCPGGLEEQANKIASALVPSAYANGVRLGGMAVLYPSKAEGDVIEQAVRAEVLPYVRVERPSYTRSPLVAWLEDCAAWSVRPSNATAQPISKLMTSWLDQQSLQAGSEGRIQRERLAGFLFAHRNPSLKLRDWLTGVRGALLSEDTLRRLRAGREDGEAFEELLQATLPGQRLGEMTLGTFGGGTGSPAQLNLMTLWGSKGCEFDVVFMLGMDEGRLPNYYAARDQARLVEARRVFYVGLTRARREVHLMWSGWLVNAKGTRYDKGASQFLRDLGNAMKQNTPVV